MFQFYWCIITLSEGSTIYTSILDNNIYLYLLKKKEISYFLLAYSTKLAYTVYHSLSIILKWIPLNVLCFQKSNRYSSRLKPSFLFLTSRTFIKMYFILKYLILIYDVFQCTFETEMEGKFISGIRPMKTKKYGLH